jgi:pyochelin synthetase
MMVQDLLFELHQRGIKLRLADGRLEVLAPPDSLTQDLRDRLKEHRDELIALVRRSGTAADPAGITPRPQSRHEPFPLTDLQHAYWVGRGRSVELGGVACHFYLELESTGLDIARLNASLRKVIERHDMLRAIIEPDGRQRILPEVPDYEIAVADLRGLPRSAAEAEIERIRADMSHQVRPTDQWPLFEIRIARSDDERLRMHLSLDVLIIDGLSLYRLFRDWRAFYTDPGWEPAPLSLSYRDYVLAEEAARDGDRWKTSERYWLDRLEDLPDAPALPLATQPARLERVTFTRRHASLPREQWDQFKNRARRRGVTPSAALMTSYADVLRMWSCQDSFTLNLTLFNRPPVHAQIGEVIGDFTSVTLLEVQARPQDSFTARADGLHQQFLRDLEHSAYSGVRVLRERSRRLGQGLGAAMPIVFTSALVLSGDDPGTDMRFFGDYVYGITQTPQVWLDHQVSEEKGQLTLVWDAVEALFPGTMLDDMFGAYRDLLARLSVSDDAWDDPGRRIPLPGWQRGEREVANSTAAPIPAATLCGLVEEAAGRYPDATAVIDSAGPVTYTELAVAARRLARRLTELGATANRLVAVVLGKGSDQVSAVLGVTGAGAAYLPIDPQWPQARRWQLLEQGEVEIVVTSPRLRDEAAWPPGLRVVTLSDPEVAQAGSAPLGDGPDPGDLAYVIFTSGSTGRPKGVMIDHRGAVNTIADINRRYGVGPRDRVLALSALSFDLSVYDIFGILAAGGTVVMPDSGSVHDPAHWAALARRHGVTIWNSVPALMQAWLEHGGGASDAPGLRLVMLSGDWIPVSMPDAIRARHPGARVDSLGGATEASIWSVCYPIAAVPPHWSRIPYGKPLANQTLHIYDHQLEPCPVWTPGDLYIGGTGVALGYWGDPDRTALQFLTHPRTGERLYRTGDIGRYLPGGDIEFLGRKDSQVKLNGYRIELGEIAAAIRRQPGVGDAAVTVSASPQGGRRQLVAYITPASSATPLSATGPSATTSSTTPLSATGPSATGPDSPPPDVSAGPSADPARRMIQAGESELARARDGLGAEIGAFDEMWRALEELCPAIMARSLAQLGVFTTEGERATAGEIVERRGVKPVYKGLVDQWLSALAVRNNLESTGAPGEYRSVRPLDAARLDRDVKDGLARLTVSGYLRTLADYFASCAEGQVPMLRGEVSPLQLLLPDGEWTVADALYSANPASHLANTAAAGVVRAFVTSLPGGRAARILEVGAGTGATSGHVLPVLPADRVSYRFTDVSTYFTQRARSRFSGFGFVSYGVFDIDREPAGQELTPGDTDVIVAANVMHDAKDLDRSLGYLRSLLAPGGILVLIEGTVNSPLQMVSVGFIEGLSQDHSDRRLPLLSVAEWQARLAGAGFADAAAIPADANATNAMVQHVLVARAGQADVADATGRSGAASEQADPATLRATIRDAIDKLLPDYMVPQHYLVIDAIPLSANGKVDLAALPSPWDDAVAADLVLPSEETERRLFEIWSEALERDDFGIHDNFFELGGDSLHAVRILGRLRDEFGLEQNAEEGLQALFDSPTIAELAALLRGQAGS